MADGDGVHRARVCAAIAALPDDAGQRINDAKINMRTGRVSLLEYPAFERDFRARK